MHARKPTHDIDRWSVDTIEHVSERGGHCVFEVQPEEGDTVELVVTIAIRELVVRGLDLDAGESPIGARVWYRKYGG
ncbi:hypothetical protein E2L06_08400 [Haloterrigena sp. H1]|uniref:DUF7861 family protein n=1 Tax=Haloterrigena sp. H1 TaxID=2552943 RepID=UPI00110EC2D8|nr:hypothetical protein [Haloterrigena sp. H1]TMT87934.1 hypothetical protein E2L06_08400 [Haloterrigena sp. H1]